MTIAYITTTVHISKDLKEALGSTTHTYAIASELSKLGHEVHIFSEKFEGDSDYEKFNDLHIHRLKRGVVKSSQEIKKSNIRKVAKYFKFITNYLLARRITRAVKETECNLILERAHSLGVGAIVSKLSKKPLILEVIDYIYSKKSAKRAKSIIAYTKSFFKEDIKEKVKIVTAGYDPTIFYPMEEKNEYDVCYVGSFKEWDGLEDLIEAIRIIKKKKPDFRTLLIGDGIRFNNIKEFVKKFSLEKNITLTGKISLREVSRYIAKAKICAAPYNIKRSERGEFEKYGFYFSPLKIFEYLACGKPIIATEYKKISEVINEENGELVKEGDVGDLSDKILKLIEKRDLDIIKKNNLDLANKYTWGKVVKEIDNIIKT